MFIALNYIIHNDAIFYILTASLLRFACLIQQPTLSNNFEPTETTSGQDDDPMLSVDVASKAGRGGGHEDVSIQLRGAAASFMGESGELEGCQNSIGGSCRGTRRCCSGK